MKYLKRLRKLRWICLLFIIFDKSRGYCVGDLLEEYEEISKRAGKVKAIKWICKQVVSSSSYLIRNPHLSVITWCKNSWAKIIVQIKLFCVTSTKISVVSRVPLSIQIYASAFCLLLLLYIPFSLFYSARKTSSLEAQYQELVPNPDLVDSRMMKVVLKPTALLRSDGQPITRIVLDSSIQTIRFQLELPYKEVRESYQVSLTGIDNKKMLTVGNLKVLDNKDISIILPARFIPEGDYMLTVSNDEEGPIQDYLFRVIGKGNR